MKTIITTAMLLLVSLTFAQEKEKLKKVQTISIQTDAICGDCEERIETKLNYTKGVVYADLSLEDMKVEVKYKTKKTSAEEIKKIISELGYNADDVKMNTVNRKALPGCCQPGVTPHKN